MNRIKSENDIATLSLVISRQGVFVYGYFHKYEKLLNMQYCIPNDITNLCLIYYDKPLYQQLPKPQIDFDDIGGLKDAKELLKEHFILPLKFPHIFGNRQKTKNMLLIYGPNGCGKSLITKAAICEANIFDTYFYLNLNDLFSNYPDLVAKAIQMLFNQAREQEKPSLIVIDEIEAKKQNDGYYTSFPRELFIEIQQIGNNRKSKIYLIGITNKPWNLYPEIRRRFDEFIYSF